jgi:hypothetical protein
VAPLAAGVRGVDSGDEAETFQAGGIQLRECLLSFVGEACNADLVPTGQAPPKGADFKAWTHLLANHLAPGAGASRLRFLLKKLALETWQYVNWLTHAENAVRMDAEIRLKGVEHLLGMSSRTAAHREDERSERGLRVLPPGGRYLRAAQTSRPSSGLKTSGSGAPAADRRSYSGGCRRASSRI